MDMQEDKLRHDHHQQGTEVSSKAHSETAATDQDVLLPKQQAGQVRDQKIDDSVDMFADNDEPNIFDEAPAPQQTLEKAIAAAVPIPQAKVLDMSMLDDWDDPDGYYRIRLGELLDDRYHIKSNLGKGMFSGVVRAIDQATNEPVAIKIIRNNEIMWEFQPLFLFLD